MVGFQENRMLDEHIWYPTEKVFINGDWQEPNSGKYIEILNPSNGEAIAKIAQGDSKDVDDAVSAANRAIKGPWGQLTAVDRGRLLLKLSSLIKTRLDDLAYIESIDVGKPLSQSRNDAIALARYFEFYGGAADKITGETIPYLNGYTVYTLREPYGVTGHIVPWNYPMQIIGRTLGAALAMGNACVLKPSEEACLTALAIGDLAIQAGFPKGSINIVPGYGSESGLSLTQHPEVRHLSFTGSVEVGKIIQTEAAKNLVPVTLELGGKSPQIVFDDANLDQAMSFLVNAGIQNAGQTCSASSRILVSKKMYPELMERMMGVYKNLRVGQALEDLELGPVISKRQKTIIENYLKFSSDLDCISTGRLEDDLPQNGNYVVPQLFGNVSTSHKLAQEEIFGPIQVLIPFEDEEEAIRIANGTKYGLVASVWTKDGARQMRIAKAIKSGQVFINNYGAGGGVELPFGGVGHSGHGREKGFEALYGFSTLKTVAAFHG